MIEKVAILPDSDLFMIFPAFVTADTGKVATNAAPVKENRPPLQ